MRNSGSAAVPSISRRRDGSAVRAFDVDEAEFEQATSGATAPRRAPESESGSHLRVVAQPVNRRSRAMSRATVMVLSISTFIIAVIVFQATIAEQQLRLDSLTTDLRLAETHYDNLRQQRAELLMPTRLREEAVMMGMYQGMSTKFMEVPADVVAEVMASTSKMNPLFADPSAAVASAGAIAQMAPLQAGQP
jgi:cell division protein FtsL